MNSNKKSSIQVYIITMVFLFPLMLLSKVYGQKPGVTSPVELEFPSGEIIQSDTVGFPGKVIKIQGTEVFCEDGLYLISLQGDYEELFRKENQKALEHPMINEPWRFCSVFSSHAGRTILMGRNWDNQNVGSIMITSFNPSNGYKSISFSRSIDIGFPLTIDLEEMQSSEFGKRLLLAPFYSMDGINEHGLCVAVSGVNAVRVTPQTGKELVFIPFLIRKILDQTKTIDEAINLVNHYIPFDLDAQSLNSHLFVADSSGRSLILEYDQNEWRIIQPDNLWQVMTNKPIYLVPDSILRKKCWRFKEIAEVLEDSAGDVNVETGMKILRDVAQRGTTWSVVYTLRKKELFFQVYQQWDKMYHLGFPQNK